MFNILDKALAKEHFDEWEVGSTPEHFATGGLFNAKVTLALEEYRDQLDALFLEECRNALAFAFTEFFGNLRVELYTNTDNPDMLLEIETVSDCFDDFNEALEPVSLRKVILDTALSYDNSDEVVGFLIKGLRTLANELEAAGATALKEEV